MDEVELEKNRFDLAYKRNLQLLNIILISVLGAIFAYIGAIILNPEKILYYTVATVLIVSFTYILYKRVNENFKEISKKIKDLI